MGIRVIASKSIHIAKVCKCKQSGCTLCLNPVADMSSHCGGWETRGLLLTRTSTLGVKSDWDAPWQGAAGGWHIPGSTSTMGHEFVRLTNPNKGTHQPSYRTSNNVSISWQKTCLVQRDTSSVTCCTLSSQIHYLCNVKLLFLSHITCNTWSSKQHKCLMLSYFE